MTCAVRYADKPVSVAGDPERSNEKCVTEVGKWQKYM